MNFFFDRRFVTLIVASSLASACGGASHPSRDEAHFTLPSRVIAAGTEGMSCWYTTMPVGADVFAWQFTTDQALGGHHLAVFEMTEDVPDGTVIDCNGPDVMTNWRPLLTGLDQHGFSFPEGFAVRVPARSRLVIQSHYVNATSDAITTHDEVGIYFKRASTGLTLVGTAANTTVDFSIAPGAGRNATFDCDVTQPMKVFDLFGHMHEWGSHITIQAGPKDAPPSVYDMDWNPTFRDHPPQNVLGFDHPLVLAPGDVIRTSCTWNNTEPTTLTFPQEMCVSMLWFYPADQSPICVKSTGVAN